MDRDWIFFLPRFRSTKKTAKAFFHAYRLTKSSRELSIHSVITVIHFSRAIKLYKRFYKIISRNYELRKFWSVDYSCCFDFRYFLSHSTTPQIKLSCKSVNWQYAVIPAVQSRNWNTRFCSTTKKTERQAKTSKKGEIIVNLCHPVKCIHRLRCLHFEESCLLLIAECWFWLYSMNKKF